jgi:hypothetical protein
MPSATPSAERERETAAARVFDAARVRVEVGMRD